MTWKVVITETFSKSFKKHKKNREFISALDKKIQRLKENPNIIGGHLSGKLKGYKSTRIIRKLRLIFKINHKENLVLLVGIDHRKFDYENFDKLIHEN